MDEKKVFGFMLVNELLDDSSEDDLPIILKRRYSQRKKRVCIINYIDVVSMYTLDDFKSHFRLERSTFKEVLDLLGPHLRVNRLGRPICNPTKQLLLALWMLVNQEVYRKVADRFNVSKATTWKYFFRICELLNKLAKNFIQWPTNERANSILQYLMEKSGIDGVIGLIDGTHIPICAPSKDAASYFNRKKYYSIQLQGVCDHKYMFTDCFTGYPGSVHDARVYKVSPLGRGITSNEIKLPGGSFLLGDSAYKNTNTLLTPYKDNGRLTEEKKYYNYKHSSIRIYIEHTFGLLKGRFRCLKYLNIYKTELIPKVIIACCVLHNICMSFHDDDVRIEENEENDVNTSNTDSVDKGNLVKRDIIARELYRDRI